MTEDIITLIAQSPGMEVVARNSTFKYKNTNPDVRDVGRDLNADYVVEGSIRPIGDRIRVTLQVIDAATGSHVWAEKYDRDISEFFALQDDVSLGIAAAVGDAVFRTDYRNINQSRTEDLSAWALTSRADVNLNKADFGKSDIEMARQAIELDPGYALAYAVLGRSLASYTLFYTNESLKNNPDLAEAQAAVRTAQKLAPNDPKVLAYLAITLLWTGHPEQALPIAEIVPGISPSYAEGLAYYGDILIHNGNSREAIPYLEKAIRLTPNAPQLGLYSIMLSEAYIDQGDWSSAERHMTDGLRHFGNEGMFPLRYLAGVQLQLGKRMEAEALLRRSDGLGTSRPLERDKEVMEFYTRSGSGDRFTKLFDDLIALQRTLDENAARR
jgi:tetratricopeptide (TPR) repeat protein